MRRDSHAATGNENAASTPDPKKNRLATETGLSISATDTISCQRFGSKWVEWCEDKMGRKQLPFICIGLAAQVNCDGGLRGSATKLAAA